MSLSRRIKRRQQAQFRPKASTKSQVKQAIAKLDPQMLKKLEDASKSLEKALNEEPLSADVQGAIAGLLQERPDILDTLNTLSTTEVLSLLDPHDQLRRLLAEADSPIAGVEDPIVELPK